MKRYVSSRSVPRGVSDFFFDEIPKKRGLGEIQILSSPNFVKAILLGQLGDDAANRGERNILIIIEKIVRFFKSSILLL